MCTCCVFRIRLDHRNSLVLRCSRVTDHSQVKLAQASITSPVTVLSQCWLSIFSGIRRFEFRLTGGLLDRLDTLPSMVQFVLVGLSFQTLLTMLRDRDGTKFCRHVADSNQSRAEPILGLRPSSFLPGFLSTPGLQLLHILEFVNRAGLSFQILSLTLLYNDRATCREWWSRLYTPHVCPDRQSREWRSPQSRGGTRTPRSLSRGSVVHHSWHIFSIDIFDNVANRYWSVQS